MFIRIKKKKGAVDQRIHLESFLIDNAVFKQHYNYDVLSFFGDNEIIHTPHHSFVTFTYAFSKGEMSLFVGELSAKRFTIAKFPKVDLDGEILVFDVLLFNAMHGSYKDFFGEYAHAYHNRRRSNNFFVVSATEIQDVNLPLPFSKIMNHPAIVLRFTKEEE